MDLPSKADALYSQCGQPFYSRGAITSHEAVCGYCIAQNRRNK